MRILCKHIGFRKTETIRYHRDRIHIFHNLENYNNPGHIDRISFHRILPNIRKYQLSKEIIFFKLKMTNSLDWNITWDSNNTFPVLAKDESSTRHNPVEPIWWQSQGRQGSSSSGRTPLGLNHPKSHFSQFIPVVCFYWKIRSDKIRKRQKSRD